MPDTRVTIIGCGLIGGSIGLALERRRPDWQVVALDREERIPAMEEAGVADVCGPVGDAPTHLPESALVILATPVEVILEQIERIAPYLRPGTVVTDVGSVKAPIMALARKVLREGVCFIGGHPIAGSEVSGVEAADPLLFKERVFVLCPDADTPADALHFMIDVVEDLLAWPVTIEPEEHDRIMAMVSHVPQLLSVALFKAAMEDDAAHGMLEVLAGRGFLDLTRLAASDFELWRGILGTNRAAIRTSLDRLERSLKSLRSDMEQGSLAESWGQVSERRRRMDIEKLPRLRLPEWRRLIDRCDEEILRALARRMHVASRIGTLKRQREAPVIDPDRERRMMAKRRQWAEALDLPGSLVDELYSMIMKYSRQTQSHPASDR